jgi:ribonuclease H2 subunit B
LDANKTEAIASAIASAPPKEKVKASADKKRKSAKASVGVEKLKKVNTTGMAKLSSFFSKA